MAYIGKEPADSFISFAKQDFTTSATTSYTLDNAVTNENELALFINFVRQEPTTAYTASGTTLTLTSATASTDDMYCLYLGQAKQTVNPPSGSVGSSQVAASIITGQTAETSIATDDTVLIHDTSAGALRKMTRANFVSGVGGANTPAFHAKTTSDISVANTTSTELVFPSEDFDTASAYDTSNGRFTPQTAGKYLIVSCIVIKVIADGSEAMLQIRKNGVFNDNSNQKDLVGKNNYNSNLSASTIVELNGSSDYVSIFAYHDGGASKNVQGSFGAFKIIGA